MSSLKVYSSVFFSQKKSFHTGYNLAMWKYQRPLQEPRRNDQASQIRRNFQVPERHDARKIKVRATPRGCRFRSPPA